MTIPLHQIANLATGLYLQTDAQGDTYYLQGVHFDDAGTFDDQVRPQVKSGPKTDKHLLRDGDVLFAAKGLNNFAVVFKELEIGGPAVASSSFIVLRLIEGSNSPVSANYLAWYLTYAPEVKAFHKQLGTTIPSISISTLSGLEVVIPPRETQNSIVAVQALRYREKHLIQLIEKKKDYLIKHQLLHAATR